jgi:hypothetical protein
MMGMTRQRIIESTRPGSETGISGVGGANENENDATKGTQTDGRCQVVRHSDIVSA